ncbi:MAG: ribonuclease H-like domain-containing protein [Bacillota bacterium]
MDLRQRLERLKEMQNLGLKWASELPPPDPADRRGHDGLAHPVRPVQPPEEVLGGRLVDTPHGPTLVVERDYPLSYAHGNAPLEGALAVEGRPLSQLLRRRDESSWDWTQAAFFDTETTGLAGGAGTYIFLAGVGRIEEGRFHLTQFFLRDYSEEDAWLWAVEEHLNRFSHLVTFNGKSFDWPLLVTRFTLQRRRPPQAGQDHLDLLHPARRIWRERLQQCNLTALEQGVLDFQRQGDVPGALIPPLYFQYLRSADVSPLVPVLEHNRLDILAMAALVGRLGSILADPLAADLHSADLYSLGRHCELEGESRDAIACYEAALSREDLPQGTRVKLWRNLSALYKRQRQDDEAVSLWRTLIDRRLTGSLWPYVELAKYYEHRARDLEAARQVVRLALEQAVTRRALLRLPDNDPTLEDLRHRLTRLERRIALAEARKARGA